jgi:hypothetical protein
MTWALSGKGGFELRGVVKPLAFVWRHLAQLALYHLFSRRATRKSDILYTYRVVVFGFALSLYHNKRSLEKILISQESMVRYVNKE